MTFEAELLWDRVAGGTPRRCPHGARSCRVPPSPLVEAHAFPKPKGLLLTITGHPMADFQMRVQTGCSLLCPRGAGTKSCLVSSQEREASKKPWPEIRSPGRRSALQGPTVTPCRWAMQRPQFTHRPGRQTGLRPLGGEHRAR